MREPFAKIAFVDTSLTGKFAACEASLRVERLVKTEGVANAYHCDASSTTEIAQHLADELIKLRFIHCASLTLFCFAVCSSCTALLPRSHFGKTAFFQS